MWKPTVGDHVLLAVASDWAGERITELESLAEGEDSRAVAFSSTRAGARGSRIASLAGWDGVSAGKLCPRPTRSPWCRCPEVYEVGTVGDLAWCISARVNGRTLQELSAVEARAVGPALVDVWRAIGSVPRPVDDARPGAFADRPAPTWVQFLDNQDAEVEAAREGLEEAVGRDLLAATMRVLHQRPADMDEGRLVHFDFGSNNVMVAEGRISAVLDWDYPGWGDPLWDVATLHAWREWLPCMDIHVDCFDAELALLPSYRDRVCFYGAHIVLGALRWEQFIGGDPRVSSALGAGLRRLLP